MLRLVRTGNTLNDSRSKFKCNSSHLLVGHKTWRMCVRRRNLSIRRIVSSKWYIKFVTILIIITFEQSKVLRESHTPKLRPPQPNSAIVIARLSNEEKKKEDLNQFLRHPILFDANEVPSPIALEHHFWHICASRFTNRRQMALGYQKQKLRLSRTSWEPSKVWRGGGKSEPARSERQESNFT